MKFLGAPLVIGLLLSGIAVAVVSCDQSKKDQTTVTKQAGSDSMKRETLTSGLQYEVMTPAKEGARQPEKGNVVTVHYTGWLADKDGNPIMDKKFDSSVDRGTPFQFVIGRGQVIKGWDEGVMLMKVGEKRRLILPPAIAYGAYGAGAKIPGNATLVFDVELLDLK
jgi:FKBP-type peptidyl-prolyl cis-trans isomerase